MKHLFLSLALVSLLCAAPAQAQGRHRHHAATEQVAPETANNDDENVAYSDTTSVDESDDASEPAAVVSHTHGAADPLNLDRYDNPFSFFVALFSFGFGGILLALLIVLVVFLFAFGPFILLFMLLRYLLRRHNDRVELAEKAMAAGQPIPERLKPLDKQGDEYMWRRGVKSAATGFGLMVMFSFWQADALVGIGGLVLCLGIGQMVIARTTRRHDPSDGDELSGGGNRSGENVE